MNGITVRDATHDEANTIVQMIRCMVADMAGYGGYAPAVDDTAWSTLTAGIAEELKSNRAKYVVAESSNGDPVGAAGGQLIDLGGAFAPMNTGLGTRGRRRAMRLECAGQQSRGRPLSKSRVLHIRAQAGASAVTAFSLTILPRARRLWATCSGKRWCGSLSWSSQRTSRIPCLQQQRRCRRRGFALKVARHA